MSDDDILAMIFSPETPFTASSAPATTQETTPPDDDPNIKARELQAVQLAESGEHQAAKLILDDLILEFPSRASTYNNRAQLLQLMGLIEAALQDLDQGLSLPIIPGPVAWRLYSQRGVIRKRQGDEAGAMADFQSAASLGDPFAKTQVAAMNPYAAMCNTMLAKMCAM